MENFKNHISPFNLLKKEKPKDPMAPTYIKPDGTKVIEQENEIGKTIYEVCPDYTLICRTYDKSNNLVLDYIRQRNLEIGHTYDEYGKKVFEFNTVYDENNQMAQNIQIQSEYYDNGNKSKDIILKIPGEIKSEIHYNETGEIIEKIEYRGSIKTYFDKDDKPIKREIDKGAGGIITEDLRNK